ncbi:uncharacterized protein LOC111031651 [Myzus persicae]|uniref:uncharacterized protein LOC111031651 n=1 Tax=Myzus persicae TaxID=13164 RepID=UPI000B937225|nr:uncharacterized protein LOC111031651 [Myzus persicae]
MHFKETTITTSKTMFWIFVILLITSDIIDRNQHVQAMEYTKNNLTNSDPIWNKWTDCKGSCGETGYMSRYRSTTSSDILCEFNQEWKTCHILGCTISNYTKSTEGNELRTGELNYILLQARNVNRMVLDACFSGNCNYYALKNAFTNNTDRLWNALLCVKHNLGCPGKWMSVI